MIKQTYLIGREIYIITIKGKKVYYKDRKIAQPIQMIPIDKRVEKMILTSRNRIDKKLTDQFKLNRKEQEEYDNAIKEDINIEERLAEICKKDALKEKSKLLKEERE